MVTQQKIAEFSGETVRNIAGTLSWFARPPRQSEVLSRNWFVHLPKNQNRDELQSAIKALTENFRKRHDAVVAFQEQLQKAAEDFPPGREIDPDDIAVPALEKSEAYFRKEREELRDIRDALQRTGGAEVYGAEVFAELERLDKLFEYLVVSLQELRWAIMVHDGALDPSTGETCASGAEFMASMEKGKSFEGSPSRQGSGYGSIEITPNISGGKPRIAGHRITVENIVIWHERMGKSVDEIATEYDLTLADVYAALAYYFDHRAEIDQSIEESKAFVKALRQQTFSKISEKLRKRCNMENRAWTRCNLWRR